MLSAWLELYDVTMKHLKNPHAAALGKLGGKARLERISPERRREIAQLAALARADQLTAKRRREIAAMGGKASAGKPKRGKE